MINNGVLIVPTRYEALRDAVGSSQLGNVLIKPDADIAAISKAAVEVKSSSQGKLLFVLGGTGIGKTTLASSSHIFLPKLVSGVVTPPPDYEVALGDLPTWLAKEVRPNKEAAAGGVLVVNLDGRELPVLDEKSHQAAMVNLNAYLRRNANVLAIWPVINRNSAESLARVLTEVGGASALATPSIHELRGVQPDRYFDALQLILEATGARLEDAAITRDEVESLVTESASVGDYLSRVQQLVVARYDIGDLAETLPRISIVVTSNGDASQACRMLRRGNKYIVDPERLLQFSRANVAEDWRKYGRRNARHSLSFISSLFQVRLLHLTSSMVVNACAFGDDATLGSVVRKHYQNPIRLNAANTMSKSSLVRSLKGLEDVVPAGAQASTNVTKAYQALQKLSRDRHRSINEAIVKVLVDQLKFDLEELKFEHRPIADRGLTVDCWFKNSDRPDTFEFTHRQKADLSAPFISSYVLTKLMDYARDYGLL